MVAAPSKVGASFTCTCRAQSCFPCAACDGAINKGRPSCGRPPYRRSRVGGGKNGSPKVAVPTAAGLNDCSFLRPLRCPQMGGKRTLAIGTAECHSHPAAPEIVLTSCNPTSVIVKCDPPPAVRRYDRDAVRPLVDWPSERELHQIPVLRVDPVCPRPRPQVAYAAISS
jgi:hypothetical protein